MVYTRHRPFEQKEIDPWRLTYCTSNTTYVFSDVLRPDGLVARVRGVQRAQEQPGMKREKENLLQISCKLYSKGKIPIGDFMYSLHEVQGASCGRGKAFVDILVGSSDYQLNWWAGGTYNAYET